MIKITTFRFPARALRPGSENVKTLKEFLEFFVALDVACKSSLRLLESVDSRWAPCDVVQHFGSVRL